MDGPTDERDMLVVEHGVQKGYVRRLCTVQSVFWDYLEYCV